MEIERKFEISGFPKDLPLLEEAMMRQGYLCTAPAVRIRSTERGGEISYMLCIKGAGTLVREEIETPITADVFLRVERLIGLPLVNKEYRAYALPGGEKLEVSLVDEGEPTEFMYAEVEFASEEEAKAFAPPAFLGRELTELPGSSMSAYWNRKAAVAAAKRDPRREEI